LRKKERQTSNIKMKLQKDVCIRMLTAQFMSNLNS